MTRKILFSLFILSVGFSILPATIQARDLNNFKRFSVFFSANADVNLNGKWKLTVSLPDQAIPISLDLSQSDKTFSGTMSSVLGDGKVINGAINESDFSAIVQANIQGQDMEIQMKGKLEGEKMSGTLLIPNADPFGFEGTKEKSN